MARILMATLMPVVMIILGGGFATAADEKESEQAKLTRTVRLKVKVTVDFKKEQLAEILNEVNTQVKNAKSEDGKKITPIKFLYDTGVSKNTRYDYSCKDKPLDEVLTELLKGADLSYVVVSGKPNDQTDGAVRITKGK